MQIKGKHVLITGGAKRVGKHLALGLLADGARLTLHHFRSDMSEWRARNVGVVRADLRSPGEISAAVALAVSQQGPVDVLINSASTFFPKPALETTEQEWDELLSTNLKGQFFFARAVGKDMLERGGVILNIADVSGTTGAKGYTAYVCSKAGLLMLTKNLAKEWAPRVRVNSISPGPVLEPEHYGNEERERAIRRTLMKRWGSPDDVLSAARFLIHDDYITGFDLKVDGGRSLA